MDSGSALLQHLGWQQFHGANMQSAMMYSGMGNMMGAQGLAGGMMSQGMAIGGPMMGGLSGMLGLDPLSMGMKAGSLAWRGGAGVLGAGLAGAGAMAGVGVLGAGMSWAGGQMMSGVQQQMALNRGLSQNFNFMNGAGGMGFTPTQGHRIGEDIRSMTHELGTGGEMATFSELSRLAVNMGRMGMGQNVRTVKEFKEKFKQMVDSVKTIATELGTSLEEAQKMMASMRQVGIFKPGQAASAAGMMRTTALSGGLAMSEISAMMNIGSQISRSVGGLGNAGAIGGMRTIGQVGTAMQMGALSEEDIYNATGLTGAEGKQAFATEMMSRSANFLRSGRGRRFLASVAGSNGTLDPSAMMEWMTGGVGTGRTMELAGKNLSHVGRANFIRNEGRLRGAALEQFGGMLQPMVYKQWLQQRGWDPNNMDDMSMLAFQRFSGLGRDEADAALKVVDRLPEIMREQGATRSMQGYGDAVARRSKQTGMEGFKRKLEHSRERIQGRLQQFGADLLEEGSTTIAEYFNKLIGAYEQTADQSVVEGVKAIRSGGGVLGLARDRALQKGPRMMFGADAATQRHIDRLTGGTTDKAEEQRRRGMEQRVDAALRGAERAKSGDFVEVEQFMKGSGGAYNEWLSGAGMKYGGVERAAKTREFLQSRALSGDKHAEAMLDALKKAGPGSAKEAELISGLETKANVSGADSLAAALKSDLDRAELHPVGAGGPTTQRRRDEQLGALIGPYRTASAGARLAGAAARSVSGIALGFGSIFEIGRELSKTGLDSTWGDVDRAFMKKTKSEMAGEAIENAVIEGISGVGKERAMRGELLRDREMQEMMAGIMQGTGGGYTKAQERLKELQGKATRHEGSPRETEELNMLRATQGAGALNEYMIRNNITNVDALKDEDREQILAAAKRRTGNESLTFDQILRDGAVVAGGLRGVAARQEKERRDQIKAMNLSENSRYREMGLAKYDDSGKLQLTQAFKTDTRKAIQAAGGKGDAGAGDEVLGLAERIMNYDLSAEGASSTEYQDLVVNQRKALGRMSVEQKRALARSAAGTWVGEEAAAAVGQETRLAGLKKGAGRRGMTGAAADIAAVGSYLGADLNKDVVANILKGGEGASSTAILRELGVTDKMLAGDGGAGFKAQIDLATQKMREGKTGEAAQILSSAKADAPKEIAKALEDAETRKAAKSGDPTAKVVDAVNSSAREIVAAIDRNNKEKPTP